MLVEDGGSNSWAEKKTCVDHVGDFSFKVFQVSQTCRNEQVSPESQNPGPVNTQQ